MKECLLWLGLASGWDAPVPSKVGPEDGWTGMETEPECSLGGFEATLFALHFLALLQAADSFGRSTMENERQVMLQKWCS